MEHDFGLVYNRWVHLSKSVYSGGISYFKYPTFPSHPESWVLGISFVCNYVSTYN